MSPGYRFPSRPIQRQMARCLTSGQPITEGPSRMRPVPAQRLLCRQPPTPGGHTHAWTSDWSSDATHHWHECSAAGCPVTSDSAKDGYGAHTYDNDTDTICNDCGYVRTITPPTPEHTHKWSTAWDSNATHHWHECSAAGCPVTSNSVKDGYGVHVYDNSTDTSCNICGYTRTIVTPPNPSDWAETYYISVPQFTGGEIIPSTRNAERR